MPCHCARPVNGQWIGEWMYIHMNIRTCTSMYFLNWYASNETHSNHDLLVLHTAPTTYTQSQLLLRHHTTFRFPTPYSIQPVYMCVALFNCWVGGFPLPHSIATQTWKQLLTQSQRQGSLLLFSNVHARIPLLCTPRSVAPDLACRMKSRKL